MVSNWVDVTILAIVAWNVASGVRRGFVGAAVDLVALLLSVAAAVTLTTPVAGWATGTLGISDTLAQPVAFTVLWIIAALVLAVIGEFLTGPFQFLVAGSALDRLLSLAPSATKGLALAGFALTLVAAPPPFLVELASGALSDLQKGIENSELGPRLLDGMSAYDHWLVTRLGGDLKLGLSPVPERTGSGSEAIARILPGSDLPLQRRDGTAQPPPISVGTPITGQGFPSQAYEALDLLDRSGNSWVRNAVSRWVTAVRFVGGGDAAGHLPATGYFGRTMPTWYPDGVYYSEIEFAESQRTRGKFLAGWLAHEATHVLQSNTDQQAYSDCSIRESQAYLLQGYVLLDLFGQNLDAIRRAPGVYPHEIRYATAAKSGDLGAMVRYAREIGEC